MSHLVLGTRLVDEKPELVSLSRRDLQHHTLVVGQSGSGKSFLVVRLVEEILARTTARVVILDPNGDFRSVWQMGDDTWDELKPLRQRLDEVNALCKEIPGIAQFDNEEDFRDVWNTRTFVYLEAGQRPADLPKTSGRTVRQPLLLHWADLGAERDFLLQANAITYPTLALGIDACKEYEEAQAANQRLGLRTLADAVRHFLAQGVPSEYAYAKDLLPTDWKAVHAACRELENRYELWWPQGSEDTQSRPLGLSDYVDGAFPSLSSKTTTTPAVAWDALTLSLDAAQIDDSLLTADALLARLWTRAKEALSDEIARKDSGESELSRDHLPTTAFRVPIFIVIDEAHNFAPRETSDPLRRRVTDWLLRVASEGRKYGLYLILATQRPTKLHPELVPECENSCVLRVQSGVEQRFASEHLGVDHGMAETADGFKQGQGLLHGRWADGKTILMRAAPARTRVSGGGLSDYGADHLASVPPPPPGPEVNALRAQVKVLMMDALKDASEAVPLVKLANKIREQFPDAGPSSEWLGEGAFKGLLLSLELPGLQVGGKPPGYAALEGTHTLPHSEELRARIANSPRTPSTPAGPSATG